MQFNIHQQIFEKYPQLLVGLLVCKNIENGPAPVALTTRLRSAESALRSRIPNPDDLKSNPVIAAWQEAHRAFGSNPNKFPSSIHALCKRVIKGGELPAISTLVDLYNIVSLNHMLPVGGEDLNRCKGNIVLTVAVGTEPFTALGSTGNEPPEPGEIIYRDDEGVLCRKFNWREATRTCLTGNTTSTVLVIEAIPPTTRVQLESALNELQDLVQKFCGKDATRAILDSTHLVHNF